MIEHPEMGKGKNHWEWDMSRQGLSWKAKLKFTIDQVIKGSENFVDFLRKCADFGVLVEYNPNHKIDLKFMLAEQKERNPRAKFTRSRASVRTLPHFTIELIRAQREFIAPPIKACQKDEGREEIYQGRKPQEYSCIARLSDAEKFSIWQVLLARFSWGSNNIFI